MPLPFHKWSGGWILVVYRVQNKIRLIFKIKTAKDSQPRPGFFVVIVVFQMDAGEHSDIVLSCQSLHIWLCLAGCGLAKAM